MGLSMRQCPVDWRAVCLHFKVGMAAALLSRRGCFFAQSRPLRGLRSLCEYVLATSSPALPT